MNSATSARIGIYGATGSTGTELASWIARHPRCELVFATARSAAGQSLRSVDPAAPDVRLVHPDEADLEGIDVAFVCLPHGHSAEVAARCFRAGKRVVDLSGDLRLQSPHAHAAIYGSPRDETVAAAAVYGLTELRRAEIADARLISNPGCYPTISALCLAPFIDRLERAPIINALSGVSGAGRAATPLTHFCAVHEDVRPYKLGRSHRHVAEIEQTLGHRVVFNPHVVPMERGMLATIHIRLDAELSEQQAHERLTQRYGDEPFIEVLPLGDVSRIRSVVRTNRVQLALNAVYKEPREWMLTGALDNLVKGAAGQALQNMNCMLGWPEIAGLEFV
ncbi:MAG: N-acetyl-gamma-glutamyl-phosphate reductase [Myxococcota bacterium]